MSLRGKSPELIEKRLKALFYSCAGGGKTYCSLQFPAPYLIDTEKGAEHKQYVELIKKRKGAIAQLYTYDDIMSEVKALLTEKHSYKTLIIDPLTHMYDNLLEKSAQELTTANNPTGTAHGAHYGKANKGMKKLLNLLIRLDMNIIITTHSKNVYGDNMKREGETFDCYKKLDHFFDLVIEISKFNKQRLAKVIKSRIATLEELSQFDFSYDYIATQYGKDILEKDAASEKLATQEQLKEIKRLCINFTVPKKTIEKWLMQAHANSFEDMETTKIQKCIDYINSKMQIKESEKEAENENT